MLLFDTFRNLLNAVLGKDQEYELLVKNGDISAVKSKMVYKGDAAEQALREYNPDTHEITRRPDKVIKDKKGEFKDFKKVWKLAIPYQVYINEIALVFMYGRPVRWAQRSTGTDKAYKAFLDVLDQTRFNSKIRECKRIAGSETESAMLFRVFQEEGKPGVQIRVLARSKGDEIYTRWDQYENLISVAWGYYTKNADNSTEYHFDVFLKDRIYHCSRKSLGWEVLEEVNLIGKIPVLLFQQEKEWDGVESLIHREESIASSTADNNDYFSNPIMMVSADAIKNMPDKDEQGKMIVTDGKESASNAAAYLTWDSAPESKRQELEWLQEKILSMTFTPKITLDTLKSVSQLSSKALRTVMMLADIKANRRKESHDEMLSRAASLVKAIIANVLNISIRGEIEKLEVAHEFQEPFGEDVVEAINNIVRSVDSGILSTESALELNPLVKDSIREKQRLEQERQSAIEQQMSIFGGSQEEGAQSAR